MKIDKLIIDGYSFNEDQSWLLVDMVLKYTDVSDPKQVQDYLKKHKVEEERDEIILRNPDSHGRHFSLRK